MSIVRLFVSLVALSSTAGSASAQAPAPPAGDSIAAPHVNLTSAQKQIIYVSVSKTQKNYAAPTGFRATVGVVVPASIVLASVPATIVELIPETKGLEIALVEGQVLLVEPTGRNVVAVLAQEP